MGRRARSTSSSTTRTSSARLRGREVRRAPPPRDRENQEVLWHAVRSDILSAISTDHCAFLWDGQKSMGKDDFSKIPNGGPGLENRLHMIHEFGVRTGRISLNRMVELLSSEPGEARPVPAEGDDRPRVGCGHRRLRPGEAAPDHRRDAALEDRLQPLRGTEVTGSQTVLSAATCSSTTASSSPSPGSASSSSARRSGRLLPAAALTKTKRGGAPGTFPLPGAHRAAPRGPPSSHERRGG